jgi:enoyl-CoA hydratase
MNSKWLKSTEHVTFAVSNRIATITLNRPEKRNAISQVAARIPSGIARGG